VQRKTESRHVPVDSGNTDPLLSMMERDMIADTACASGDNACNPAAFLAANSEIDSVSEMSEVVSYPSSPLTAQTEAGISLRSLTGACWRWSVHWSVVASRCAAHVEGLTAGLARAMTPHPRDGPSGGTSQHGVLLRLKNPI
jgi:hypothetical protein